jgi:hypothetical protein
MKKEPLMSPGSLAASMLGLGLMLAPASPVFAGISSFSIDRDTTATFNSTTATYTVTVRGSVMCPSGEAVNISVQITQFHGGLDFDTASGSTGKPISCSTTLPSPPGALSTLNWVVFATCTQSTGCNTIGLRSGAALAVANAIATGGKIAQTTSEININLGQ